VIIDTHAHLADESLSSQLEEVIAQAAAADVRAILCVATTLATTRQCLAIAERAPAVRATAGIHPNYTAAATDAEFDAVASLAEHPRVAAIGETGLDRYWDDAPWELQLAYFRKHIALSRRLDKPLVIHTRDCAAETLEVLQAAYSAGPFRGVMHSFTGPQAVADGCLALGLYISFAGMLTYKNAADIRAIAATIPPERLLVETDSPYLTPHPHRGKRPNTPAHVVHTLDCLAEVRGVPRAELAAQTTRNAETLFGPW
jgi:TatD DNase family protein